MLIYKKACGGFGANNMTMPENGITQVEECGFNRQKNGMNVDVPENGFKKWAHENFHSKN